MAVGNILKDFFRKYFPVLIQYPKYAAPEVYLKTQIDQYYILTNILKSKLNNGFIKYVQMQLLNATMIIRWSIPTLKIESRI